MVLAKSWWSWTKGPALVSNKTENILIDGLVDMVCFGLGYGLLSVHTKPKNLNRCYSHS